MQIVQEQLQQLFNHRKLLKLSKEPPVPHSQKPKAITSERRLESSASCHVLARRRSKSEAEHLFLNPNWYEVMRQYSLSRNRSLSTVNLPVLGSMFLLFVLFHLGFVVQVIRG